MSKPKVSKKEMLDCLECLIEHTPCKEENCSNPIHAHWAFETCEGLCQAIRAAIEERGRLKVFLCTRKTELRDLLQIILGPDFTNAKPDALHRCVEMLKELRDLKLDGEAGE